MSWDFLNSESEEVKRAFSRISETEKALRKVLDNYRPSVMTIPHGRRSVYLPPYLAPHVAEPTGHTADPFHRYRRTKHRLSRIRHPGNTSRQHAAC